MKIKALVVGMVGANCYIVSDESGEGVVIDPGGDAEKIISAINGISVKAVLNTHGHCDHIECNDAIRDATGAPLFIHEKDAGMLSDAKMNLSAFMGYTALSRPAEKLLKEGDKITFGKTELSVLHTPGHTPGGVSFIGEGAAFTGDAIFAESVGRTDFPGGSSRILMESIREKILTLPDDTKIFSGHGPVTTVGHEKNHNLFLRWG